MIGGKGIKTVLVSILLLFVVIGSILLHRLNNPYPIILYSDDILMQHEILRVVPVGSSVQHAQAVMTQNGFSCNSESDGTLGCFKNVQTLPFYEGREWYIGFYLNRKMVSNVSVSIAAS